MRRTILLLTFLVAACGAPKEEAWSGESPEAIAATAPAATSPSAASTPSTAAAPAAVTGEVRIEPAGGTPVTIRRKEETVEISYTADGEQRTLIGEPRDSGKRKYRVGNGPVLFEIKQKDDDFKLRTGDGQLRWKVKLYPDKVKVSDNEENKNPFELKWKSEKIKVVAPGDKELGDIRHDGTTATVKDASGTQRVKATGPNSAAYGLFLLDGVPDLHRYIIAAELLARGK